MALAVDIGGSLAKLVYFEPRASGSSNDKLDLEVRNGDWAALVGGEKSKDVKPASSGSRGPQTAGKRSVSTDYGRLHFLKFETRNIVECIKWVDKTLTELEENMQTKPAQRVVYATGGGAFKYAKLFQELANISLKKVDEMESIITGLNYLLKHVEDESFVFMSALNKKNPKIYASLSENPFPYLIAHIGSGVSIIRVDSEHQFERVSGTSIGGGTFLGLCQLLTNCQNFDDLLKLSAKGDNTRVDMLVGDIYGTDYSRVGLRADTIASSFGKVLMRPGHQGLPGLFGRTLRRTVGLWIDFLRQVPFVRRFVPGVPGASCGCCNACDHFRSEDIAMGLLRMVSNNIAQIAYLNALRFGLNRIYFGGHFIRDHRYTMDTISYGVNFWSKGEVKALFLQHDGYLGALGAFLHSGDAGLRASDATRCAPRLG